MLKYHFLLVSAALLSQIPVANAQIFEAVVVSVGDEDTIRVKRSFLNYRTPIKTSKKPSCLNNQAHVQIN